MHRFESFNVDVMPGLPGESLACRVACSSCHHRGELALSTSGIANAVYEALYQLGAYCQSRSDRAEISNITLLNAIAPSAVKRPFDIPNGVLGVSFVARNPLESVDRDHDSLEALFQDIEGGKPGLRAGLKPKFTGNGDIKNKDEIIALIERHFDRIQRSSAFNPYSGI